MHSGKSHFGDIPANAPLEEMVTADPIPVGVIVLWDKDKPIPDGWQDDGLLAGYRKIKKQ